MSTPEHDRGHAPELVDGARAYAQGVAYLLRQPAVRPRHLKWLRAASPGMWRWSFRFWKPTGDPVRDLVKAGSLIAAAIDALQMDEAEQR